MRRAAPAQRAWWPLWRRQGNTSPDPSHTCADPRPSWSQRGGSDCCKNCIWVCAARRCIQHTRGCSALDRLAVLPSAPGRAANRSRTSAAASYGDWSAQAQRQAGQLRLQLQRLLLLASGWRAPRQRRPCWWRRCCRLMSTCLFL